MQKELETTGIRQSFAVIYVLTLKPHYGPMGANTALLKSHNIFLKLNLKQHPIISQVDFNPCYVLQSSRRLFKNSNAQVTS